MRVRLLARRRAAGICALLLGGALWAAPSALADAAIVTPGPLTNIWVTSDLNCAVNHTGDTAGEFYGDTACGTLVAVGGHLYTPATIPAGQSATNASGALPWTAVSQSGVTGTGVPADPFTIVTVVSGGGLTLTQTDTYVVGQEQYRTDVTIHNDNGVQADGILYRGGDCYQQDDDHGPGILNTVTGVVGCLARPTSANPNRVEEWVPLTPGSSAYEAYYDDLWRTMGAQQPFDNTCACDQPDLDNAAGLSWIFHIPAGGDATYSHLTVFSPTGNRIALAKTADAPLVLPGGADGYTITATNPNAGYVTLNSITEHMPAGFSYVPGSTTGATGADPVQVGQDIAWAGPFVLPPGGVLTLHFGVRAAAAVGAYADSVDGTAAGSTTVLGTGPTAGVIVATPPTVTGNPYTTQTLTCSPGGWPPGESARAYQWTRNGAPIPGATAQGYVPTSADIGTSLACIESVAYGTALYSLPSAPVTIVGPPVNTALPHVTGSLAPGGVLTCNRGQWTNAPTSYAYRWLRGGAPIAGASRQTYTTTAADAGRSVACVETATNLGGSTSATSRGVSVRAAVAAPGPADVTLERGPRGRGFRIQVLYIVRATCSNPCRAKAELRTRSGKRLYAATSKLPGDGKVVLGTRSGLKLPLHRKIRFYITVSKAALLKAPFKTIGGYRVAETRLRVWLTTPRGTLQTVRDGHIKVSIARIKSGALPGLKGVL